MQELKFEQVEDVSGGYLSGPFERHFEQENPHQDTSGIGGVTVASGTMGLSNFGGAAVVGRVLGTGPGLVVAGLGQVVNFAFNLTQEGRDGMRVQNHPATRHLYDADGKRIKD
ncbi:hypothetical protein QWY20_07085 [Alkalimonas sp. MEB108]|uniref:Uncharacterized protein n=1 Tax=Alkalimonas cellulosilytica TaxID=3058395 RepID=A0ABU7J4L5_9GAMM|nr:hypothetical protein [Alkalimonas sp. MEB108]MEE2001215.1 hypothetical protein [Alkalimonas sp. MEB108]